MVLPITWGVTFEKPLPIWTISSLIKKRENDNFSAYHIKFYDVKVKVICEMF